MKGRIISVVVGFPLALLGGYGSLGTVALAQDDGRVPSGLTLLAADDTACSGVLMLEAGSPAGDEGEGRVREGEYAVFELQDENVAWTCEEPSSGDTLECPNGTTHLRVLRGADDDLVLFECFGQGR